MSLAHSRILFARAFRGWWAPIVRPSGERREVHATAFESFNINVLASLDRTVVLNRAVEALDVAWLIWIRERSPGQDHAVIDNRSATKGLRDENELNSCSLVPTILSSQSVWIRGLNRGKLDWCLITNEPVARVGGVCSSCFLGLGFSFGGFSILSE